VVWGDFPMRAPSHFHPTPRTWPLQRPGCEITGATAGRSFWGACKKAPTEPGLQLSIRGRPVVTGGGSETTMRAFGAPVNSGVRLGLLPFATQLDGALPLPRFLAGVRARASSLQLAYMKGA
jgi:hypothetical protein